MESNGFYWTLIDSKFSQLWFNLVNLIYNECHYKDYIYNNLIQMFDSVK